MTCPKCGSTRIDIADSMQVTDDIDEGTLVYYLCADCGYEWEEMSE
jgi:DNA-directed RNA polymerase subunit M/transcription elongation factor TFIIS